MKLKANTKKIIVLCTMVVLLVVTGTVNFFLQGKFGDKAPVGNPDNPPTVTTFFSSYRTELHTRRATTIANLDSIINSEMTSAEAKTSAEKQKLSICANMEKELVLESLIKSKGFNEVVVTMSTENINVLVDKTEISKADAAKILNIITEQTSYKAVDVVVSPFPA
ncbi:MAG: SpoIIIAH-like family protein [Clostridia bacterium]